MYKQYATVCITQHQCNGVVVVALSACTVMSPPTDFDRLLQTIERKFKINCVRKESMDIVQSFHITQRFGELFVKNMLIFYFCMVIIKKYKVKISVTNFRKDWNKFPEIFREKFPDISELTTLIHFKILMLSVEYMMFSIKPQIIITFLTQTHESII